MKTLRFLLFTLFSIALILVMASCSAMTGSSNGVPAAQAAASQPGATLQPIQAGAGTPTVHFRLTTGMDGGKMAFFGMDGDMAGKANPDLNVNPGDVVEITLVNGDGIQHDLTLPDFGVESDKVSQKGAEARVVFKAQAVGTYPYFCSLPGHRQAGMEGRLVVGNPAPTVEAQLPDISRAPDDLPGPLNRTTPEHVRFDLEAKEIVGKLADGVSYTFMTFNGKVPGPFIRVRVGDTVEVHLKNDASNTMAHSVDFHAVTGPGGGSVSTQTKPGEETSFTFQALKPGIFVYHCATPMVAEHISNGMYGLILVEPEDGLPKVDREFYVMQGEVYTQQAFGQKGPATFSEQKLLDERPEYLVFNGAVGALTQDHPLQANVGETIRIFFGVGGPNLTSSFHVIGEIFDQVYNLGSLTSPPLTDVQTTIVPPGGATAVLITLIVPGRFILVDHALARMERGLAGYLIVSGPDAPQIFNGGSPGN